MTSLYLAVLLAATGANPPPKVADERLVVECVASSPDIVTPTGLAVDRHGRVWVIENHTHQRPEKYDGPKFDRVRVFEDFDRDGKARKITTFADEFVNAMGLAIGPDDSVYLATRNAIYRLRDTKKTGKADEKTLLVQLDTKGDYPHNGLSGFAFDALGDLYFGLGENLGVDYALIGSDKTTLKGGGEGGSVYRCKTDGTGLERIATGFWNPFGLAFDRCGRLYAVDNDPDARGPCRLLHVVRGGDYGYRFRYGRKGQHPFQAWNGELPGTLPMAAGTSEAPSGIVFYEGATLPADYRGKLFSTSWGDHVLEMFTLKGRGGSMQGTSKPLLSGTENFRPVAVAVAPDGSLVLTDWVDKSYPVHGKGAIWRVRAKAVEAIKRPDLDDLPKLEPKQLGELLKDPRRDIRLATGRLLATKDGGDAVLRDVFRHDNDAVARLHALWAAMGLEPKAARQILLLAFNDEAPEVRAQACELAWRLPKLLDAKERAEALFVRAFKDSDAQVRVQALVHLETDLDLKELIPLLGDADPFLVTGAVLALGRPAHVGELTKHVQAKELPLRLGVLLALRRAGTKEANATLDNFLNDDAPEVRRAAIQWVAEEKLKDYFDRLDAAAAKAPVQRELFEALLAARLIVEKRNIDDGEIMVSAVALDDKRPAAFRALALRMLRPDHPGLTPARLKDMVADKDAGVRREALRTLARRPDEASQELLRAAARNEGLPSEVRNDAIAGLALSANTEKTYDLLRGLLGDKDYRRDALRSLRQSLNDKQEAALIEWALQHADDAELCEQVLLALSAARLGKEDADLTKIRAGAGKRPADAADWKKVLGKGGGDPAAGERVFFHARGAQCMACHRVEGRGAAIGPELSTVGAAMPRERLVESILEPSKEIAPLFTNWVIQLKSGQTKTGVIVTERHDSLVTLADAEGKLHQIKRLDIEERTASPLSLMPDNLHQRLTRREFLDLIAFLEQQGRAKK